MQSNRLIILRLYGCVCLCCVGFIPSGCKSEDSQPAPNVTPERTIAPIVSLRDVTADSGITFLHERGAYGDYLFPELIGAGGAFLDYDNDGDLDIYLVQGGDPDGDNDGHRNRLYRNDGGRFIDVSSAARADVPGYGMGCAAADYDNDGDIDIFVTRLGPNVLLRNDGNGVFDDVTKTAGVGDAGFGASSAFLDYDRDGLLDLYVVNYVQWSRVVEHTCYSPDGLRDYCGPGEYPPAFDKLYHNLGDGRFEDVSKSTGVASIARDGLGIACTDVDNDGWIDIYVANDQMPAFCWINQGDGTFLEEAEVRGCAVNENGVPIAGMGVAVEDIDGNGFENILITNIAMQTHLFLVNSGGYFEDRTRQFGLSGWNVLETGFGVAWVDLENDGVPELFVANGAVGRNASAPDAARPYAQYNQLARRTDSGRYEVVAPLSIPALRSNEVSRSVIQGDYDNDGDMDLLITNNGARPQLLRNDTVNDYHWVTLTLRDEEKHRDALNARVELVAGNRTYRKTVRSQSGYLGSNDPRIHFGIGNAARIDHINVIWPDGIKQRFAGLSPDRHHILRKGP